MAQNTNAGTEERQKTQILESEGWQKEERKQEADKTEDLSKAMQSQLQEHATIELSFLHGDLGELCSDLNGREVKLSTVEKSVSNIKQDVYKRQCLRHSWWITYNFQIDMVRIFVLRNILLL